MKKFIKIILILMMGLNMASCDNKESDALKFKKAYEAINGTSNVNGTLMRELSIDEDNPFVYITSSEIIEKVNNKETFYIYFGSPYCPWCRSMINETIKVAKANNVSTIYYLDVWGGDDHTEVFRDKYEVVSGKLVQVEKGSDDYFTILKLFDNVLSDYVVDEISVNEKRISAPNLIYVSNGQAIKLTEAISSMQTSSNQELTQDILDDEDKLLNEFFNNNDSCDIEKSC